MASRYAPAPLDMLLAVLPSIPRPILARLTARLIERMDEIEDHDDGHNHPAYRHGRPNVGG